MTGKCTEENDEYTSQRIREAVLLTAATKGKFNEIIYAMEEAMDININCTNTAGKSLINVAVLNGHYNIANAILHKNADNLPREYFDDWFKAAKEGLLKQLDGLLDKGVHID